MVKGWGVLVLILVIVVFCSSFDVSATSEKEIRERFYGDLVNSTAVDNGEGSIAKMFDRVLEKEFSENDQPDGSGESSFNSSVADQQAELETVAKITHEKITKNETKEANGTKIFQLQDVFSLENEDFDDMTTLIDKKADFRHGTCDRLCRHWWNNLFMFGTTSWLLLVIYLRDQSLDLVV